MVWHTICFLSFGRKVVSALEGIGFDSVEIMIRQTDVRQDSRKLSCWANAVIERSTDPRWRRFWKIGQLH